MYLKPMLDNESRIARFNKTFRATWDLRKQLHETTVGIAFYKHLDARSLAVQKYVRPECNQVQKRRVPLERQIRLLFMFRVLFCTLMRFPHTHRTLESFNINTPSYGQRKLEGRRG